jgi:N-acetylneuraminate lyase
MAGNLGIYVASVTPFDKNGRCDPDALLRLMDRNLKEGASGFFLGGSSAECFLLSHEERVAMFEAASVFLGKTNLIAHVGALSTWEAVRYGKEAKALGYTRIAATPPLYYGYSVHEICTYYKSIVEEVGLPVMVYNFPGNTKRDFDLENPEYQELFKSDAIWGVKHTNQVVAQLERFMVLNPKLQLFNGFDETMIATMAYGCTGSIGSTFNCMLPHYLKIYNAFQEGRMDEARLLQHKANNIMAALCKVGLIPAVKCVLAMQGNDVGLSRSPFSNPNEEQKAYLRKVLEENLVR